jgi:hypothetical protein
VALEALLKEERRIVNTARRVKEKLYFGFLYLVYILNTVDMEGEGGPLARQQASLAAQERE